MSAAVNVQAVAPSDPGVATPLGLKWHVLCAGGGRHGELQRAEGAGGGVPLAAGGGDGPRTSAGALGI